MSAIALAVPHGVVNKVLHGRRSAGCQNLARELHLGGSVEANQLMRTRK